MPLASPCFRSFYVHVCQFLVRTVSHKRSSFAPAPGFLEHGTAGSNKNLTSTENAPWNHRPGGLVVELKDEGEHQVEPVAILGDEVKTENVTDRFDRVRVVFACLDWEAAQHACFGRVAC
jgi:hypothetical protein